MENGAVSVRAMCTHPVFSGPAYERIADSALTEMIVTDTIPLREGVNTDKIKVLSVSGLFGDVMKKVMSYESISSHFVIQ
jgi:ribose-phosphate pyrophosphokinase